MTTRPVRVLLITDHAAFEDGVLAAVRHRVARGPVQFRVLVPNPARGEVHLLHPERHEAVRAAEHVLRACLTQVERAAGGPVVGSVSIRNDPYEAVQESLLVEPVDEFLVALSPGGLTRALHLDLPHRLKHFGLPVGVVESEISTVSAF